jgi:hypothetical protein
VSAAPHLHASTLRLDVCDAPPECLVVAAGLHALLGARGLARATGRRLHILGPVDEAARVLELTGTRELVI